MTKLKNINIQYIYIYINTIIYIYILICIHVYVFIYLNNFGYRYAYIHICFISNTDYIRILPDPVTDFSDGYRIFRIFLTAQFEASLLRFN